MQPSTDADAWQHEPALACSEMTSPLWLMDGVSRVSERVTLFPGYFHSSITSTNGILRSLGIKQHSKKLQRWIEPKT